MGDLSHGEFRAIWDSISEPHKQRIKDKCAWEQMTPWQVLNEWPALRDLAPLETQRG
jgi:hypothetical protein